MKFSKYHALGNDYIVLNPADGIPALEATRIQRICHRNFGVGSDGILLGPSKRDGSDFFLRIYNPDGSEAEKSGNGLRIFSRYLWDHRLVNTDPFTILTLGGLVSARVFDAGKMVSVEMGSVSFQSNRIPVAGPHREVINETLRLGNTDLTFSAATIGNPHCVLVRDDVSEEEARRLGPCIETHPMFPNRINVQFMKVIDRTNIRIEIWERGAGYTLASGSSGSAAAAVAHRLGLCDAQLVVHMPGGDIDIVISGNYAVRMTGPVTKICDGRLDPDMF